MRDGPPTYVSCTGDIGDGAIYGFRCDLCHKWFHLDCLDNKLRKSIRKMYNRSLPLPKCPLCNDKIDKLDSVDKVNWTHVAQKTTLTNPILNNGSGDGCESVSTVASDGNEDTDD